MRRILVGTSLSILFTFGCASGQSANSSLGVGGSGGSTSEEPSTGTDTGGGHGASSTSSSHAASSSSGVGGAGGAGGGGGASSSSSGSSSSSSTGGGPDCSHGCPAGFYDIDNNPLTGVCGCEYACTKTSDSDPIDPNFTDDNCDGGDGLVEQCVYVAAGDGDDSAGTGTRSAPVKTIAHAISVAQAHGVPAVCLSGEVYSEKVTVVSGISIYGGFDENDPDFKFRRSANVTTTVTAQGVVFDAPQIDQDTHIEGLTIQAAATGQPGDTTYGVRLGGGLGQLFVRYDDIIVDVGGDGGQGTPGSAPAQLVATGGIDGKDGAQKNSSSGGGGPAPSCTVPGGAGGHGGGDGQNGIDGSPGSGSSSGQGTGGPSNGCTPVISSCGTSGGKGDDGAVSTQGTPGSGGNALGTILSGKYSPAPGGSGGVGNNGKAGAGGGGGGGGSGGGACFGDWDEGGGGGSGGCGGLGGDFGRGGKGGGASFGIFAAAGKITVSGNQIQTSKGGNGGKGGDGALAQQGGAGSKGGNCSDDSGPGGPGGKGGDGGAGGPGGGGGGGASACLGHGAGVVTVFNTNSCTTGVPGFGGQGGTNPSGGVANSGNTGTASANLTIN